MVEAGDASELAAALRECEEEIGLDPASAQVLGRLDERITVQGFRLAPFVARIPSAAGLRAGPEVEEIFEVPFRALSLPGCETTEVWPARGGFGPRVVFRYRYEGREIWGLTARLVRDLLDLV